MKSNISGLIMRRYLIFVLMLFVVSLVHAETYRWVDENGKVHFSDKKPPDKQAEDISGSLKQQNTDYGGRGVEKQLQQYERNRAARDTEQRQTREQTSKGEEQRAQQCRKARRDLRVIKGRVIFYDENNREIKVTEKEREQRAKGLEAQIKQYCS